MSEKTLEDRISDTYEFVKKHKIRRATLAEVAGYSREYISKLFTKKVPLNQRNVTTMEESVKKYIEVYASKIHREKEREMLEDFTNVGKCDRDFGHKNDFKHVFGRSRNQ